MIRSSSAKALERKRGKGLESFRFDLLFLCTVQYNVFRASPWVDRPVGWHR